MKKMLLVFLTIFGLSAAACATQVKVDYWVINASGGMSYPVMDMGNYNNGGIDFSASVRKGLDSEIQVGGGLAFVNMPYKLSGAAGPFSATVLDIEGVYAPYLPDFIIWPYAKVQLDLDMLKYSKNDLNTLNSVYDSDTGFGFAGGAGVNYPINNQVFATLEILYNQVSVSGGTGDMYSYFTFNIGVTMLLK
jgi:opacity protein-like surface antigen